MSNSRKGKKVSFYYPKKIQGVNLPEGSDISSKKKRQVRLARLSDAILGRKATVALGNTTVDIARGASQAIGMVIGDPHMRDRTQLRDLVPIKLLISARVHRLSFSHPSLDINSVLYDTGKKSMRKNSRHHKGNIISNYSSYRNSMTSLVRAEQHRLSRDGIIEDHFARRKGSRKTRLKSPDSHKPVVKGMRRLISKTYQTPSSLPTMNIDDVRLIHSRNLRNTSEEDKDKDTKKAFPGSLKDDAENLLSYAAPGQSFAAEVRKDSVLGQIGRYLPEISCRVPKSAICMELVNMSQPVKSTQPFVVEAPHILWGTARDPLFHEVAVEGCPFVDRRNFEFFPDSEIQKVEHSESLMLITSTVWVDYLPQHDNMQSFASVVRNNAVGVLEKANNMLNNNISVERMTSSVDKTFINGDVGEKASSGSSIILKVDFDSQHNQGANGSLPHSAMEKSSGIILEDTDIKRIFASKRHSSLSKNSLEFDFASNFSYSEGEVGKYEDCIKQTLPYNNDIVTTSELSIDKAASISQQLPSLVLSQPPVCKPIEETLDEPSSVGKEIKQDFLEKAASEWHQTSNNSIKKTSKGVASDVSSKHSVSSHASGAAKSFLGDNESIHFKSIASGTLSSHPANIQKFQPNNSVTSVSQGASKHTAIEMAELPIIEAPQSPEIRYQLFLNNALPSINAPESPEIDNQICKNNAPPYKHDFPTIISLNFKSALPPTILAPETAESNTVTFGKDAPPSIHIPKYPVTNNRIRKDVETQNVDAPERSEISIRNIENFAPSSLHTPKSQQNDAQVFKADRSSPESLKVADVLGFSENWFTLKSQKKGESEPPGDNEFLIPDRSCVSQSKACASHSSIEDDEHNICSQRQRHSIQERKFRISIPESGPTQSKKSPNIDSPYILVLDEIIYFNVVEFPEGDVIASFPVSVASVLSERTADDLDRLPGEPSELTLTFCQEPSVIDQVWGVEATVTFRCTIADPPQGRKFRFLNRKKGSKGKISQDTSEENPEEMSTSRGQTMENDQSSSKSKSQEGNYIKDVQSGSNDFSSCSSASIPLSKNLFYDAQVEPVARERKRRRGQKSPTSNESSFLHGWDLGNEGSFDTELSQAIFNSLLSHPKSSSLLQTSVKVDQFDVCASPHPNSNQAEYEKAPNPSTESLPAQQEEDLHFNKVLDPSKRRSSLHLLLHNSKAFVVKNVAKYLSSVGEESDKISLIRKDLIQQGSIMGSVGEESFKAALRANITDKWRRPSFAEQRKNFSSQQSTCQVIDSQCSEGASDIQQHGATDASDGSLDFSKEIPRSRWLQLNPLIRTWTWIPTFLKVFFNFYTFLFFGVTVAIFLVSALINYNYFR